jgi:hypothetical protein
MLGRLDLLTVALLLVFAIAFAAHAPAHEWYPLECCSGDDCAPVDKVEVLTDRHEVSKNGTLANLLGMPAHAAVPPLLVTTKHGSVIVPADFPRRWSKDSQMHACIHPIGGGAVMLMCIFMPPTN